ncbi:MAG: hypothetical protein O2958_08675 [Gemmatimonadetes bacterium]|nr:hypothetical protein [Gemmatimonadota bacterium]MDA1103770.1 hypothetical protein [Gemmatimonadota bacterium]
MKRRREVGEGGAVLLVVVLMGLAMYTLAHALHLMAAAALEESRAAARHVELQASADGGVAAALQEPPGAWMDSVDIGRWGPDIRAETGGLSVSTRWRRLASEVWLVESTARWFGRLATDSHRLVWVYDPIERIRALPGVVSVGPSADVAVAGRLLGDAITEVRAPLDEEACAPWITRVTEAMPTGVKPPLGQIESLGLGLLDFETLRTLAVTALGPVGTPQPEEAAGECVGDGPWNWGDPDRPFRPCGPHLTLRRGVESTEVVGGVGQGTLVIDGDLVLSAGARFYGFLLIAGRLRVLEGASVEGLVVAFEGVEIASDATVTGSACWALRALAALRPALGAPIPIHEARRFGPFD